MISLVPLVVATPLVAAVFLTAYQALVKRGARLVDVVTIIVSVLTALGCIALLASVGPDPVVYWFGGWDPRSDVIPGIAFYVDEVAAGLAALVALMNAAVFVYVWGRHRPEGPRFRILLLVFEAAMIGFVFAGDFFTLFVFLELMSIPAYALTAFRVESGGPLQGSMNFAITSSVGSIMLLYGIALIYRHTGELNMAAAGTELASQPVTALTSISVALILSGLFVKAAIVPFHFWHAEAHAVAPSPVCALFSAVMTPLGLYAIARVYWAAFAGAIEPSSEGLRGMLVMAGVITAIVGSIMCLFQLHVRRLLAFSAVAHVGLMAVGVGLLDAGGITGSIIYATGHALVKAPLFLLVGLLIAEFDTASERELFGQGRGRWLIGGLFGLAGLGLAGLPPFGTFTGSAIIDHAASQAGFGWVAIVVLFVSGLTGGAVLRLGGRVFLGVGSQPHGEESEEKETEKEARETVEEPQDIYGQDSRLIQIVPTAALIVCAIGAGFPAVVDATSSAAAAMIDTIGYASAMIGPGDVAAPQVPIVPYPTFRQLLLAMAGVTAALGVAAIALWGKRLPSSVARHSRLVPRAMSPLRAAHSGHPGDYVAWAFAGTAFVSIFLLALAT